MTESQAQSLALSRQSSQELEIKRREAVYNDVLAKQQMVKISPEYRNCDWRASLSAALHKLSSIQKSLPSFVGQIGAVCPNPPRDFIMVWLLAGALPV